MSTTHPFRFGRLAPLLLLGCILGCHRDAAPATPTPPTSRAETTTWGPATVQLELAPATPRLDRDAILTIRLTAPEGMRLALPALTDRCLGFTIGDTFDTDPVSADGYTRWERRVRLIPLVAPEYRIGAIPVTYEDNRVKPPLAGWFPTTPINLDLAPLLDDDPGNAIVADLAPLWIRPAARTITLYTVGLLGALLLILLLWKLMNRVREEIRVRAMSPRERAMRELSQLLAKNLLARGRIKDFYVELTMIMRRYIERQHGIRAPEQTTEEFLAAVMADARFKRAAIARLETFLQAADMVKFAAYVPDADHSQDAARTAGDFIEHDDLALQAQREEAKVGRIEGEVHHV